MRFITILLLMAWLVGIAILIGSLAYPDDLIAWVNWTNNNFVKDHFPWRFSVDPTAYQPYGYVISGVIPLCLCGLIFRSARLKRQLLRRIARLETERQILAAEVSDRLPAIEGRQSAHEARPILTEEGHNLARSRLRQLKERQQKLINSTRQLQLGDNSLASLLAEVNGLDTILTTTLDALDGDRDGLTAMCQALEQEATKQSDRLVMLEVLPPKLEAIKAALTQLKERGDKLDGNGEFTNLFNEVREIDQLVMEKVTELETVGDEGGSEYYVNKFAGDADGLAKRLGELESLPIRLASLREKLESCKAMAEKLNGKDGIQHKVTAINELNKEVEETLGEIEEDEDGNAIADTLDNLESGLGAINARFQKLERSKEQLTKILAAAAGNAKPG